MSLKVKVREALKLPNLRLTALGTSDPLAVVKFRGNKRHTKAVKNNLNPKWEVEFEFQLDQPLHKLENLEVLIYDESLFGLRLFMCSAQVPLRDVIEKGKTLEVHSLFAEEGRKMEAAVKVELVLVKPEGSSSSQAPSSTQAVQPTAVTNSDQAGSAVPPQLGKTVSPSGGSSAGDQLSGSLKLPDKPLDFQVRVHVLEARRLFGNNLKAAVKVVCGSKIRQTSARKATSAPYWDETLVFNFHEKPIDFMKKSVDIKVLDASSQLSFIKDTMIGLFKVDVGWVYNEPEHAIIHKWLLLVDPQDMSMSTKGYLKVSVIVVAPGAKAKHSPASMDADVTDIESNLLRPSGARLQPSVLRVRIYRGEDFPQMDPSSSKYFTKMFSLGKQVKDDLVDPYTVVSFAGHKETTPTISYTSRPLWNREVNLEVRFPSVCDKLKIAIIDEDSLSTDDYIGTLSIDIPKISATGRQGFLPTFGPAFANLYGSTREYSKVPSRKNTLMNKGKEEGVAYRGRVLVEVDLMVGVTPKLTQAVIADHIQQKVMPHLLRKAYVLHACFLNASMILPTNQSVYFEVSIGNYGNSLDTTLPPSSSTTPHHYPVFDGNRYHHITWSDTKPCVVISSQWEDNTYRIAFFNILLSISAQLSNSITAIKDTMMDDGYETEEVKSQLLQTVAHLLDLTKKPLPTLPISNIASQNVTKLDVQLRAWRVQAIGEIVKDAEAMQRTGSKKSVNDLLSELDELHQRLSALAFEPQISIPNVVVWMLVGEKRVCSVSIPAHQLMHIPPSLWAGSAPPHGELCGKAHTVMLTPALQPPDGSSSDMEGRAKVHLVLWMGLASHAAEVPLWADQVAGRTVVFAETYENQANAGTWGTIGLMRPHFSDATGSVSLPKDGFEVPPGWAWDGEWFVTTGSSIVLPGAGMGLDSRIIYEVQERQPYTSFENYSSAWMDNFGAVLPISSKAEVNPPEGWEWETGSEWKLELLRPVDQAGWEYTKDMTVNQWSPADTVDRLIRRRMWTRSMTMLPEEATDASGIDNPTNPGSKEGFEYARLPHLKYYPKAQTLFLARRRRWVRKMTLGTKDVAAIQQPVFYFKRKQSALSILDSSSEGYTVSPHITLAFPPHSRHRYQFRAYLYQARNMFASDNSGLSDPYAVVCFDDQSRTSQVCGNTLNPIWDQTLVINDVILFGEPKDIENYLPIVTVEFYDKDTVTMDDFLGVTQVRPVVSLDGSYPSAPSLQWFPIRRAGRQEGEILAAFVLFLAEGIKLPEIFSPKPEMELTQIEVLSWGVRGMSNHLFLPVEQPLVQLQCAGVRACMNQPISSIKNFPNFPEPHLTMTVEVPKNPRYASPLELKVLDHRLFGWKPVVGSHVMNLNKALCNGGSCVDRMGIVARALALKARKSQLSRRCDLFHTEVSLNFDKAEEIEDSAQIPTSTSGVEEYDWWSKYYTSQPGHTLKHSEYENAGLDLLKVLPGPLEDVYDDDFEDLLKSYPLTTNTGLLGLQETKNVGSLKAVVGVYTTGESSRTAAPKLFKDVHTMEPTVCLVRVYIVEGLDLQATDSRTGKADPYIALQIGNSVVSDRDGYIANELNPKFGKVFELTATLPVDQVLTISVKDRDRLALADDLIGETSIDLENRFLTQHRAICGLPMSFTVKGFNMWRDAQLPVDILTEWCQIKYGELESPHWEGTKAVVVGLKRYRLQDFESRPPHSNVGPEQQRLALHILRSDGLVLEHVETRSLVNPSKDIAQGQLRMWVDIFPTYLCRIPPPVIISPRKPQSYFLRVVVYRTKNIPLVDRSAITGEANTDIYVKGMLMAQDMPQKTDVHYRSVDGEGSFNWRFVFPFQYIPQENAMIVKKKKGFFDIDQTEWRLAPRLIIQVWDNDIILPDKYIGMLELDLLSMPKHSKSSRRCSLDQLKSSASKVSLLKTKKLRGWWPASILVGEGEEEIKELTGKLELELQLLTEAEANELPAGKGRKEPNMNPHLPEPNRPATSFFWLTSPLKTCNYIVCKKNKRRLTCCLINFCLLFFGCFCCLTIFVALISGTIGLGFTAAANNINSGNATS